MIYVRKQFNRMVLEQAFYSESQAILSAHKAFKEGSWQHIIVHNSETQTNILELGMSPDDAQELVYATAV